MSKRRSSYGYFHLSQDSQLHPRLPDPKGIPPIHRGTRPKKGNPGYVFPAKQEGAIFQGQSSVRRKAAMYAKKAGVKTIKLHEFRHSCVSNLLASSLSVRVVARWVGDTERMVRDTYSHLLPSEKDIIRDFFDGIAD